MAATYSEGTGIIQAQSYVDILDVLQLLPDNTQKLIGPKDVRDAILSAWENPPFRWTQSDGNYYVGIARSDVKDFKFFIGKKELSNSPILTQSLINTDTDIFLYNTKPDSDPNQNLKITFLAGNNPSAFTTAPSLEVKRVIGLTPSLSLDITHNQPFGGDFNFIAGQFGKISINNLKFPSQNETSAMVGNPTTANSNDLFLVRNSTGLIEFKTPAAVTSTIGDSNTVLNLFGSEAYLNGFSLEFTELLPTPLDLGGVPAGSTFSNVPLSEMIRRILYPYLPPLVILNLPQLIFERDHNPTPFDTVSIDYSYILTQRTNPIVLTELTITGLFWNETITLPNTPGTYNSNYNALQKGDIAANNSAVASYTFSISTTDGTQSTTDESVVNFVYPYFYGFSDSLDPQIALIDLDKIIDLKDDQSVFVAGDNDYLYFMYPSEYGLLTEVEDTDLISYDLSSFTYSLPPDIPSLNSIDGKWSAASYIVYRTIDKVTIPLPSKKLTFKF
jgi:hypothetical protein